MRFKIENLKNFSIMPNTFLKDKKLNLKAKGLLATMYSLPNDWDYTVNGLCKITKTGLRAIRSALESLEIHGYLTRYETKNEKGQFDYEYIIRIEPKKEDKFKLKNVTSLRRTKEQLHI